jgi:Tol biopolymer transport system component
MYKVMWCERNEMRTETVLVAILAASELFNQCQPALAQKDKLPRISGAELLEEGYQPDRLLLAGEHKTRTILEGEGAFSPSISADGSTIAFAHRSQDSTPSSEAGFVVSTYSLTDDRWTNYPAFGDARGPVAISPDGSKLACVTHDLQGAPPRLRVFDLKTGEISVITQPGQEPGGGISWSPDGRFIAFDALNMQSPSPVDREIYVVDIKTGVPSRIASGLSPSWSPSGEWIAYIGHSQRRYQASLMRPDGRFSQILTSFSSGVIPNLKPVWSPDSERLLINESRNADLATFDICMVEVKSRKLTRRFKSVAPVWAWISAT